MSSPKAASRAAAPKAVASLAALLSPARAAASRRNGAKSRGPKTPDGKARSAQNALRHGLCADNYLVSAEEELDYEALEAALVAELAPQGVLQAILVTRIVRATWRLERADRLAAGTGVGAPFPNPAAKRPSCSSSACRAMRTSGWR